MLKFIIQAGLVAAGFAGASASTAASGRQAVAITPDNVELTEAGGVKFPVDFTKLSLAGSVEQAIAVKLWFDVQGNTIQCDPVDGDAANVAALCVQAMAHARLNFAPGFIQPLRRGFVVIRVTATPYRTYQLEPDRPIDFSGRGAAVMMHLVLARQPDGAAGQHCSVSSGLLPSRDQTKLSDAAQSDICAAFLDRQASGQQPCRPISGPAAVRWTTYECRVAARAGAYTITVRSGASEVPQYMHADLSYPPDDTVPADRLGAREGQLQSRIGPGDYPPMMMRMGLSGRVQVLLGVRSDGGIATCRPLVSSGTAALDNATCSRLVRRGHYDFKTTPVYQGLRYTTASVNWVLP